MTSCAWRSAGESSTGQGRASTTPSRSGSQHSVISRRTRSPARRGSARSTRSPRRVSRPFAAWARTPVTFTPVKSEPLTRLLITDLVGEAPTREAIGTLRDDIADLFGRIEESEASAELLPHRRKYLQLTNAFLRRLLDLHLEWIDEVERELAPEDEREPRAAA